ncbi:hypothetical protein NDU88_000360 [Pleurodeles waltl]|uniref:MHC class I antigen n=1 Tax=Pleurodeles waltl TaxID=8319 RepID=A0AAV7S524_PLEWA|nr:hypothetical protein NDU88_000360 [Pleurodeles waltl]
MQVTATCVPKSAQGLEAHRKEQRAGRWSWEEEGEKWMWLGDAVDGRKVKVENEVWHTRGKEEGKEWEK